MLINVQEIYFLSSDAERQGYCIPSVLRILMQKALLILDSLINCLTFQTHLRDGPAMTPMEGTVRLVQHASPCTCLSALTQEP